MYYLLEAFKLFAPKVAFGISLSLGGGTSSGGSRSKSTTTTTGKKDTTEEAVSKKTATGTKETTGAKDSTSIAGKTSEVSSEQLSEISSLDEATQGILQDLIATLAGQDVGSTREALKTRAIEGEGRRQDLIDEAVGAAVSKGEERVGQVGQQLARQAGSSQNTIVQQLTLREGSKVDREVAELAATLGFQSDQLSTADLSAATEGETTAIAQLADVLKGATATQTQTGKTSEQSELITKLSEILSSREVSAEESRSEEFSKILALLQSTEKAKGSGSSREKSVGLGFSL